MMQTCRVFFFCRFNVAFVDRPNLLTRVTQSNTGFDTVMHRGTCNTVGIYIIVIWINAHLTMPPPPPSLFGVLARTIAAL